MPIKPKPALIMIPAGLRCDMILSVQNKSRSNPQESMPGQKRNNNRFFYGWVVAISSMVILYAYSSGHGSFGVFLKPLVEELGSSRASISGAISARALTSGILAIVVGVLIDKLGPRKVLLVSISLSGLGFLLLSTLDNLWQIYLYLGFLVGIGGSAIYTATISTVARWFGEKSTAAMAVATSGYGLGTVITPPLASLVLINYGWRPAFVALGLLILFLGPLALVWLRPPPHQREHPLESKTAPIVENTRLPLESVPYAKNDFSLTEAIQTRPFWFISAIFMLQALSYLLLTTHIVANATDAGIEVTSAAFALTFIGISSIAGRLLSGVIAYRLGSTSTLAVSLFICIPVLLWLIVAKEAWHFYIISTIFGLGTGGLHPLIPNITTVYFGNKSIGSLLGVQVLAFCIGAIIGPLLGGYIFDATQSYSWAFAIAAITMALAFIISLLLKPPIRANSTL